MARHIKNTGRAEQFEMVLFTRPVPEGGPACGFYWQVKNEYLLKGGTGKRVE
jgi:hypothetical protein